MSANPELLRTQGAEPAFRMLIACCKNNSLVTYKQLASFLAEEIPWSTDKIWRHMGDVVGDLMDSIWAKVEKTAPPINLLVINGGTKLPSSGSDGHLDQYLRATGSLYSLSNTERKTLLDRMFYDVWAYEKWPEVYETLFNQFDEKRIPAAPNKPVYIEQDGKSRRSGYGGPAEGADHKELKEAVLNNPERILGTSNLIYSKPEFRLKSGDEVDALFASQREVVCVEIKSRISSDKDIERGIYQCIKYQAVKAAEEQSNGSEVSLRPVRSVLVIGKKSIKNKLRKLANSLGIEMQLWKEFL